MSHNPTFVADAYMIEEIPENEFKNRIVGTGKSAVVMFYMAHCPHCQRFMPEFEELSRGIKVTTARVEISKYYDNDLWDEFHIEAVPTVIAFREGQICTRVDALRGVGLGREKLESEIKSKPECFTA